MKRQKTILLILGFLLMFALVLGYSEPVKAAQKVTVTKPLVYQKPLDIFVGQGGVYFPSSSYTGKAVLTRAEPINTKNLTFTHRWLDIQLLDVNGKEIKSVYGYIYVYFNLNSDDYAAWKKDKLGIYYYDPAISKWVECPTSYVASKSSPYGRVSCMITQDFGRYGIAINR
jgi:hypothetical protein